MTSDQVYRACADPRKESNSAGDSQPPWRTETQTIVQGSQLWSRWDEGRDTKCSRKKAEPGGWLVKGAQGGRGSEVLGQAGQRRGARGPAKVGGGRDRHGTCEAKVPCALCATHSCAPRTGRQPPTPEPW